MESAPLNLRSHTGVRRIRSRVRDDELRTDRLVGNGWTWECKHGCKGAWEPTREKAILAFAAHKLFEHGQR